MKLYLSPHRKLCVILQVNVGRHLVESDRHLTLVYALLFFATPLCFGSLAIVLSDPDYLGFHLTSVEDQS